MTVFEGVLPPIPTPFHDDYSINEEVLRSLVEHLTAEGVHGIIPTGSTGEFTRLSMDERKQVLEICVDQVRGRIPVIAGTAAAGTREVIELSRHAEAAGARGFQIVAPFYATLNDVEVYDHFRRIAESVGVPIMVYNNPRSTGIDMSPRLIARLAEMPNVVGVKEASGDSRRVRQIIALTDEDFTVCAGVDFNTLESFALGAKGWVAGTANLIPGQCVEFYEAAVLRGDYEAARTLYYEMGDLCDKMETGGNAQNVKAALEIMGFPVGPPRPPLLPRDEAEREQIGALLDAVLTVRA